MPIVPEETRLETLRRLGLSEALVRQSAGDRLHRLFEYRCQGPPFYLYHEARFPDGPPLLPLWDCHNSVTGVWVRDGRMEFIGFDIEAPQEYEVLAGTEQGFWARVFIDLYEDDWEDLEPENFREAARAVGFLFLDRLVAAYEATDVSTFAAHADFRRSLVNEIDAAASAT